MFRPEAETCRLIIKITYISCNKLFSNSCLVFNLNYYKFVVLDVHTLLFSIQSSVVQVVGRNVQPNSPICVFVGSYQTKIQGKELKRDSY